PARERARTISLFMTATAMAGVLGAPLSSALLRLDGVWGLHGWQWLFVIEAVPAVLLAPVVLSYLTERPEEARWLTPDERLWLSETMATAQASTEGAHVRLIDAARSLRLWALALLYFCIVMA